MKTFQSGNFLVGGLNRLSKLERHEVPRSTGTSMAKKGTPRKNVCCARYDLGKEVYKYIQEL